ncbi:MAG: HAMP domain-containing histidine kinase [Gammaproteobacteria bacterium]|nr:HAMP domain-containing histidine kinase [Gammaproteobacteria bacterium]
MIRQITRSLSTRLLAIFLVTSLAYGLASRYVVDLVWGTGYLSEVVGAHMALHINYVLADIGTPPDVARAQAIVDRVPVDILLRGPDLDWQSDPRFPPLDEVGFSRSDFLLPYEENDTTGWTRTVKLMEIARHNQRAYVKIRSGEHDIVFASPKFAEAPRPNLTTPAIGLLSIIVLAACYFAVRWLVQPVQWIQAGTARIASGDLNYRLPETRKDDLGDLASGINRMADEVGEMLEAKRQLLLAISHELRSPLTRAKVALEFLDDQSIKANLMHDVREMERLIADLLESERLNTRHSKLQVSPIDLDDLVAGVIHDEFAAQDGRIRQEPAAGSMSVEGDATRLRLLLKNLIENALRYSSPDGRPVEVGIAATADGAEIRVSDFGRGMSPQDLARATEPFYRADPARSRATGGLGLGLYLCRRIAEAHGGSLAIQSELGSGTVVTVRLPGHQGAAGD